MLPEPTISVRSILELLSQTKIEKVPCFQVRRDYRAHDGKAVGLDVNVRDDNHRSFLYVTLLVYTAYDLNLAHNKILLL
jgi:hypothetical protein